MQITHDSSGPVQRRAHERYALSMRVWAVAEQRGAWLQVGDVSLDSVGCMSERRYPLMARLTLSLNITGGRGERDPKPLEVEAIVFRCTPQAGAWRLGLRLPHHNSLARERFVRFLRARFLGDRQPLEQDQS